MLELLQNFEQAAATLDPKIMVAAGLISVLSGLFVWLGGLGFRKVLVTVAGVTVGAVCAFFVIGCNILLAIIIGIVTGSVAMILEKILIAGSVFWRLVSALGCAVLGTLLIFAGMIMLLSYKGIQPVSYIGQRQSFYLGVFSAMVIFGMVAQLLFCRGVQKHPIRKKDANNT